MVLNDGTERRLSCRIQEGPDFASGDRPLWGAHQFYVVRFVARDPFLYNPDQQSASGNFNGATAVDIACDNSAGHMEAYPTIVINGAVTNPKLTLVSTGEVIEFTTTVAAGSHINVDTQEGVINLNDVAMDPLTLTKASTLFYIPRGCQTVQLTCSSGVSQVTVKWYTQFLGI